MKRKHSLEINKVGAFLRRLNKEIERLNKVARTMTEDVQQGDLNGTMDHTTGRLLDRTPPEIRDAIEHLHNARIVLEDAVCAWPKECWPKEWNQ